MGQESNNALMQQLKKHYGLSVDLFTSESSFFFEGAQRQHNLETLRHLSSFGDMVLFLTGDKGAGKTTLLKTLQHSGFEGLNVIYLDAEKAANKSQSHSGSLFLECARQLGLSVEEESSSSEILSAILKECHRIVASDGLRTLFAFDNADKISKKDLQTFLSFCRDLPPESALVMLFAGSSVLLQWSKVGSNLEQSAWCHQVQLKPLSQEDVYDYLVQALNSAGSVEKLELSELQLQQLSELGKGLPGRVNKLFSSIVLEPGLLKIQPREKNRTLPIYVLFGLASLLVMSFVFVSYQHGILDRMMPVFSLEKDGEESDSSAPMNQEEVVDVEAKEHQQKARLAMLDKALHEKGLSLSNDSHSSEHSGVIQKEILNDHSDDVLTEEKVTNVIATAKEPERIDLTLKHEPDAERVNKVATEGAKALVIQDSVGSTNGKVKKEDEVGEVLSLPSSSPPVQESFKTKSWLASQPGSYYMAQILGSYQEQTALKFIEKVGKQKFEVYYLKTERKNKPWYVVFYGMFPAKTHAQDAVKNAPKVIRSQNPWIRKASDVYASYPVSN